MIPSAIRQYIPYPRVKAFCVECHIELNPIRHDLFPRLCHCCAEMLLAVATPWLTKAHLEWDQENARMARRKIALLHPEIDLEDLDYDD